MTGAPGASSAALSAVYQERLLAEYRAPRNRRDLTDATSAAARRNPVCGDAIRVMVRERDGTLDDVAFTGEGCSLAVASASLLTQVVVTRTTADALALVGLVESLLRGDAAAGALPDALAPLAGVVPFPGRHGCVLMPWLALREALMRAAFARQGA